MRKYRTEIIIAVVFALLFGISAIISHRSARIFVIFAAFGAFCGIVGLPYLDNERWKHNVVRDMIAGIFSAEIIAYCLKATPEWYLLALVFGIIAGIFGPAIAKYAQLP